MSKKVLFFVGALACVACVVGAFIKNNNNYAESSSKDTSTKTENTEELPASSSVSNSSSQKSNPQNQTTIESNNSSSDEESPKTRNSEGSNQNTTTPLASNRTDTNAKPGTNEEPKHSIAIMDEEHATPDYSSATLSEINDMISELGEMTDEADNYSEEIAILRQRQAELLAKEYWNYNIGAPQAGDPEKGGYPYREYCPDHRGTRPDPWGMYICECVSYTAWKVQQTYGYMPYWGGRGNANQWPANARAMGLTVSNTPKPNTVGIRQDSYYGHSVWVESVNTDGSMVYVSQYNSPNAATEYNYGEYSEQWENSSAFVYIYFGQD